MGRRSGTLTLLCAGALGAVSAASGQQPAPALSPAPANMGARGLRRVAQTGPLAPRAGMPFVAPEERETFNQNLKLWRELPPAEQQEIRERVKARLQQETQKALRESGLQLDRDRQEIFMLRYAQERRKLERELRRKMEAERSQRLPLILDELKREFGAPAPVAPAPAVSPAPVAQPSAKPL